MFVVMMMDWRLREDWRDGSLYTTTWCLYTQPCLHFLHNHGLDEPGTVTNRLFL